MTHVIVAPLMKSPPPPPPPPPPLAPPFLSLQQHRKKSPSTASFLQQTLPSFPSRCQTTTLAAGAPHQLSNLPLLSPNPFGSIDLESSSFIRFMNASGNSGQSHSHSLITPHTPNVTRQTSNVKRHTSHVTRHISLCMSSHSKPGNGLRVWSVPSCSAACTGASHCSLSLCCTPSASW